MSTELQVLIIERIKELGQQAYAICQELSKWRPEPLSGLEKTNMNVKIQKLFAEQCDWAHALIETIESEEE